jgi:hypothetical protein
MVDARIATSAEQPINSNGAVSTEVVEEGDLVGLNSDGELVAADAASGEEVPAVGLMATPTDDPSTYPDGQFEYAAKQAEANRALINEDKVGYVKYGVEVVNEDADWDFSTAGDARVYLDVGGGFTQTAPSGAGEVAQVVGHAVDDGNTVFLDIQTDFDINA